VALKSEKRSIKQVSLDIFRVVGIRIKEVEQLSVWW